MAVTLATLLLCFSQFDGVTRKAKVDILPTSGFVFASEPNQTHTTIFNLEGQKIKTLELNALVGPIQEASGHIFISTVKSDGTYDLWVLSSNLVHIRHSYGITFNSANLINGKLYAYNILSHKSSRALYPKMAQAFNLQSLQYEREAILKIPLQIQNSRMLDQTFWVFDWAAEKLVLFKLEMSVFVYPSKYFERERTEAEIVAPAPVQMVPLLPEALVKNPGPFKLKKIMREDVAIRARTEWYQNKTIIFAAWAQGDSIFISYGEPTSSTSTLGVLNKSLSFQSKQSIDGRIRAGKANAGWVYKFEDDRVSIKKIQL